MPFRPVVNFQIPIGQKKYRFSEHPAAKGMPYGQTGRRATVYQVLDESGDKYALKVFTQAFRSPRIAEAATRLQSFAQTPGLGVCQRQVLTREVHSDLIENYPDLQFAVLMPWVQGETWQEFMISHRSLSFDSVHTLAGQMTLLFAGLEQNRLAHCDIAGPNVLVDFPSLGNAVTTTVSSLALVDVEEMYGPGLTKPEKLPAGTPGYDHKTAKQGLWSAEADRFAGAVMLAEILTRHDERIRQISLQEQYFDPGEMQQNSDRYQTVIHVLKGTGASLVADLFARAWFSQTLSECPTFSEWYVAINRPAAVSISSQPYPVTWRPITPGNGRPVSNPPITLPLEQVKPMLLQAAEEGRWEDVLNIAPQILQSYPAEKETLSLFQRAQSLNQLDQAIENLWRVALHSGDTDDWDICLRSIVRAQYQAKGVARYDELREDAERERDIASRATVLAQLITESRWEEAEEMRAVLPLDHPKVAELFAQMDVVMGNQARIARLLKEARQAFDERNWAAVMRLCREGLVSGAADTNLQELLDLAQREQALDQQVAETLRLAEEASTTGKWSEAEKYLQQAIQLQPARQSLQSQLAEIARKRNWAEQIEQVFVKINQKPANELLKVIEDVPAGFGNIDETRRILHETAIWQANLEVARAHYDLECIAALLGNPPDSRVHARQAEDWLRMERERESSVEIAFQHVNTQAVEAILAGLPPNHPLQPRCQDWLADFFKTKDELDAAQQAFDPERVKRILSQLPRMFPRFTELNEWSENALGAQKSLLEARARRDLPLAERLLGELPPHHPVREDVKNWLKEEKTRVSAVENVRAAYNLEQLRDLLSGIPEDDATFKDDWHWLKLQQQKIRNIQEAVDNFNPDKLSKLLESMPPSYPDHDKLDAWQKQELSLRANLQAAQKHYDLVSTQKLADSLPASHPLRAGLDDWLATYRTLAEDFQSARQAGDEERVLALLEVVTPDYPDWAALRAWGMEARERNRQAQALIDAYDPDGLETLIAGWPQDDLRLENLRAALKNMRQRQQELARMLAKAESALQEQDWQKAAQLSQEALREPKVSLRFSEIAEIAHREIETREAAEKLMRSAQQAVVEKRYVEAIGQADQVAALLPVVQPYTRAGREMREKLINMAHAAEKNRKWNDSKAIWSALKSVSIPTPSSAARSEPATAPRNAQPDALDAARAALKAGQFEIALDLAKKAAVPPSVQTAFTDEVQETLRSQAQAAQNSGKWEQAKQLWELLKKVKEAVER